MVAPVAPVTQQQLSLIAGAPTHLTRLHAGEGGGEGGLGFVKEAGYSRLISWDEIIHACTDLL